MKKIYLISILSLILFIISSCSVNANEPQDNDSGMIPEDNPVQPPDNEIISKVEKLLESMTLKEKIGQMLLVQPESLQNSSSEQDDEYKYNIVEFSSQIDEVIKNYPVGGIVFFAGNIKSPSQLVDFIDKLQQSSKIALFIASDEEGGKVSRIANSPEFDVQKFESMQAIGNTKDTEKAFEVGSVIGAYMKQYNFNLNFAPVADVYTNPNNTVIGDRAFGDDPNLVAEMLAAEIEGLHKSGIMSCIKHFPGHGDTKGDTHNGFVSIEKNWEELEKCELIPFKAGIDAQTDMVMISHITAPNITDDGLPSTLSYEMIEDKLRKELDYKGVIITDSMSMGAITERYSSGEAAVLSISAGADIVLMPENFIEAFDSIYEAVNNAVLSEERINESVLRILSLKEKYGLIE